MKNINKKTMLASALLSALLVGCNESNENNDEVQDDNNVTKDITLHFKGAVGDEDFSCGYVYSGIGSPSNSMKFNDFRLYVHDFVLKQSANGSTKAIELDDDGIWQTAGLAMLDFEDGCLNGTTETNTEIRGVVEADPNDYDTLCFTVGIPFELNHIDDATAVSPLNASGMLWSWTSGRKFLRVDGAGDPDGINQAFHIHLGSTGCVDGPDDGPEPDASCANPNRPTFCVSGFKSTNDVIAFDIKAVLEASDVTINAGGAKGCMSGTSDPECIAIMPRLNIDFTYNDGINPPSVYNKVDPQLFVKVVSP